MALNRSHIENGFTKGSQGSVDRLPLRPVTVAVNTIVTTRCDSQSRERSGRMLVVGGRDFHVGDGPDGSSTYTADEPKFTRDIV